MEIDPNRHPGLSAFERALAGEDVHAAAQALLLLNAEERALLEAQMGREALRSSYRAIRVRRSGPGLGRVIVLPGLMGTELDSVNAAGESDLVWVNYWRILRGRLDELQLTAVGEPPPPPPIIKLKQVFARAYLPLLMELHARWQTRPFPYDWRVDVDHSAAALAEVIRTWAGGEPVHLVAHSMGGIVARRFIQSFPDVWASMQDPTGQGRGGRLVMMGTPNRGSYAIAMALSGEEGIVKTLDKLDQVHDRKTLLRILNTFQGSYQLLPSPVVDLGDDHRKLFDAAAWGNLAVHEALLNRGKQFLIELDQVIDPGRLLYIAGYGQDTPHRIRITAPGRFTYQSTQDGDGRVTHELGLLPGVSTFWVRERHGDLPKNPRVLAGIHDLLQTGTTSALETSRLAVRATAATRPYDVAAEEIPDPEIDVLRAHLAQARRRGRAARPELEAELAQARLESLITKDWLGTPPTLSGEARPSKRAPVSGRRLRFEVVLGDITQAEGDVFAVGHYRGVRPQGALLALDKAVTGTDEPPLVITEQVRRGLLRGDLGDVDFYPWGETRLVAVGGMGHAGTFGEAQARVLARNVFSAIAGLPRPRVICTVLIGSGEGNLGVEPAVHALLGGVCDALQDDRLRTSVEILRLVELDLKRAPEILFRALSAAAEGLFLEVSPRVKRMPRTRSRRPAARATMLTEWIPVPSRISFVSGSGEIRASVITRTVTIPERSLRVDPALVEQLVVSMKDPDPESVPRLSALLRRLLLPREIAAVVPFTPTTSPVRDESPLVFEVDRQMARVHWEMLAATLEGGAAVRGVALVKAVARQLRTEYSPPPAPESYERRPRRALVVGDPGDPRTGHSLPGARMEALRVAEVLQSHGLEVISYVGAASDPEQHSLGVPPATRLDVLDRLLEGGWDILHYAGHGDFNPSDPDRAGWLFADGLLTSRELEQMHTAPRLVVANACLPGLTSSVRPQGWVTGRSDAALVTTLADEFYRRGVREYVGTAWEVNDEGAILFAEHFYDTLLRPSPWADSTLGGAMLAARRALAALEDVFGALWAAYQHYGDPTARLVETPVRDAVRGLGGRAAAARARTAVKRIRSRKAHRRRGR